MIGKILKKIIERFLSMFCVLKKEQIYPAYVFKNIPQILKTRFSLMIPNGEESDYLEVNVLSA